MYFQKLMLREPHCPGVITATRGNHGQAVGLAASRFKLPATVYVPQGNSVEKNTAMRALGVKLVEHGHDFQASREEAARVGVRDGLHMVPAFHPDIVLGVTSYWAELSRAPDLDIVRADRPGSGTAQLQRCACLPRAPDRRRSVSAGSS
jgi:threonine dehydratase